METTGDRRLREGCRVALREAIYGYERGSSGVVVRPRDVSGRILVRFDGTGHGVFVAPELLRVEDPPAAPAAPAARP